ncbi:transmembrane protein, putative (macronuclear) [Tetrahymena thermophila SB210]|uniref:Transmembrane protein, putative n=1 Tax=Tetrahymena thermophila (strain SB210) TaxID=312017 RepID=W7XE38_TETTS|nr:transmembrane protein, putative [Tetrahymena thermophila SB210]EWS74798.1 transmembrane protein, putative [Tetrahymena thermophila SB210]|eukprot:XP_012652691.1 transmembrane protein, putative [Tetrahymena thermophila SB210]
MHKTSNPKIIKSIFICAYVFLQKLMFYLIIIFNNIFLSYQSKQTNKQQIIVILNRKFY